MLTLRYILHVDLIIAMLPALGFSATYLVKGLPLVILESNNVLTQNARNDLCSMLTPQNAWHTLPT